MIGRLEAVDVTTSRHADADADEQSRRRRSRLRFMFHFRAYHSSAVEKRRPIEGNGGWTGGDGTCLYFPPQTLSKKMLADPGLGLVLELELPIMGRVVRG